MTREQTEEEQCDGCGRWIEEQDLTEYIDYDKVMCLCFDCLEEACLGNCQPLEM